MYVCMYKLRRNNSRKIHVNPEISTLRRINLERTYNNIISSIHHKLKTMETLIKNRHKLKLQRDNVNIVIQEKIKGKSFSRNQLERKNVKKEKEISAV